MERHSKRLIGELTSPEISQSLSKASILCMPIGSIEQHGPHLPLNTDTVLAEALTQAIIVRWGKTFDLWQLPALTLGLSREHAWAPGTISLTVETMAALLRNIGSEIARALPTRNLVVVNGHGGNCAILEALARELAADFGLNFCALHLGAMMSPPSGAAFTEIHGGKDETSVMLALAPDLVRRDLIAQVKPPKDAETIRALILDQATTWPWSSDDRRVAHLGVIGDAPAASLEHGQAIVERVIEAAGGAFERLLDNQRRSQS
jgi:creatinine amidohydrolase/Fe(II)-dependent formamide hydrolase-like protein